MSLFSPPHQLVIGTFGPRFARIPVHLDVAELATHLSVTGATGSGKSRWLAHLAVALMAQGEAVTVLDPHGDTARLILATLIARGAYDDPTAHERITYLDLPAAAARVGRYLPLNILAQPFAAPTTARLVLEALRRAWPALDDGVAPAFENAVLAGVSVLIRHKLPLVFLHDLFTDDAWRADLLKEVTDPTVRAFFQRLDHWGSRERALYLESTLRRAFLLFFSPVLRYSLGQATNALRWRERLDRGQSLVVNLALPDPDARRLLGSLLTVAIEQAALQRADVPSEERGRRHTLILDEFAAVSSQSGVALAHILEQCRKFGLGLVLSSQSSGQLDDRIRSALAGVGTTVVFRLGRQDAEEAARRIGATDPFLIKHAGGDDAAHPLYSPLPEQWEGWTRAIQRLKPRQLFVARQPPRHPIRRRLTARVARLRTPDLPDPTLDPVRLAAVESWYLREWFEVQPVVEWELANLRPTSAVPTTRRRGRIAPEDG